MRRLGLVFLLSFFCHDAVLAKVFIFSQWHLSPGKNTEDIVASKLLPQYTNQKNIYDRSLILIKQKGVRVVIAEGCSGKMGPDFAKNFNGWTLNKLIGLKNKSSFVDIVSHIPMKLKAKLGDKIKVLCGDDEQLIKQHLLAFSDLRAYVGYFMRLKQFKGKNQKKFETYAKAMKPDYLALKIQPIDYARRMAMDKLAEIKKLIIKRNEKFVDKIRLELKNNPLVIIGGIHVPDIKQRLKMEKISFEAFVPKGYGEEDVKLFDQLEQSLK